MLITTPDALRGRAQVKLRTPRACVGIGAAAVRAHGLGDRELNAGRALVVVHDETSRHTSWPPHSVYPLTPLLQAGHSLAANMANSLGQMYVAAMGTQLGLPATMALGGVLTWAAVGVAVWRIPKLWHYRDTSADGSGAGKAPAVEVDAAPPAPQTEPAADGRESRGESALLPGGARSQSHA